MKKIIFLIFTLFLFICNQTKADLIPANIKFQIINTKGEFVTKPQNKISNKNYANKIKRFRDKDSKLYGYKDKEKVIINAQYDGADFYFLDDFASASIDNKWGIINKQGEWIVQPTADSRLDYIINENVISVNINDKYGIIDKTGKWILEPTYDLILKYSEGLALACIKDKCGYINETGKWIIQPSEKIKPMCHILTKDGIYEQEFRCNPDYSCFSEGLSAIYYDKEYLVSVNENSREDKYKRYSPVFDNDLINSGLVYGKTRNNKFYIKSNPNEQEKKTLKQGILFHLKKSGYINKSGKLVLSGYYGEITPFKEGLAAVPNKDGKWGYIDKKGNWIIKPKFQAAYPFNNGYAQVELKKTKKEMPLDKYGYKSSKIKQNKIQKLQSYFNNVANADEIVPNNISQSNEKENTLIPFSAILLILIIIGIISLRKSLTRKDDDNSNG